jgi:starch phosphorylase
LFKLIRDTSKFDDFKSQISGYDKFYAADVTEKQFFGFPMDPILSVEKRLISSKVKSIAYFSMEYGLTPSFYNQFQEKKPTHEENWIRHRQVFSNDWSKDKGYDVEGNRLLDIPIYGGGLGVLAGDTIKSAADLGLPFVGVGILWNKGYFLQRFVHEQGQVADHVEWDPCSYPGLLPLDFLVKVDTKEGPLHLLLWKYYVYSHNRKQVCPLILLDSDVDENHDHFKRVTDQLYRSDSVWWKIFQRSILGIGGMKALDSLGYQIQCYHLNEGHAAFAILEQYLSLENKSTFEKERRKFVFTCHTPVAAGHDRFKLHDVANILTDEYIDAAKLFGREREDCDDVNLTHLALRNCRHCNAVSAKHGEVMNIQFPDFKDKLAAITNGVHVPTWVSDSFAQLFDRYELTFRGWRDSSKELANVYGLRSDQEFRRNLFQAHLTNKRQLANILEHWEIKEDVLTIGWARRVAGYKRPSLIFQNIEELVRLSNEVGRLQIILAGKAHPCDDVGGRYIDEILRYIDQLKDRGKNLKVLILGNYDTYLGRLLTSSVDVWLNNPLPPFEASGTSGMKAILNGVLQLSTLDGWIVEAADNDIGWIFGFRHEGADIGNEHELRMQEDAADLYRNLQQVMQMYYRTYSWGEINLKSPWIDKMINCLKTSAYFSSQRMVQQYQEKMWSDI